MRNKYSTIYKPAHGEVTEKRSRFLGDLAPAATEQDALAFIESIKKAHPDARHHCFAFITGSSDGTTEIIRASDDGEPSQTAGQPMLRVLQGYELHDVVLVVTRYFGGTLLGTGGLTRAYAAAAEEAVIAADVIEKIPAVISRLEIDYSFIGKLPSLFAKYDVCPLKEDYTDKVTYRLLVPDNSFENLACDITEMTAARFGLSSGNQVLYSMIDGKPFIYD